MPNKKNFNENSIKKVHMILKELRESTETNERKALSQRELAAVINISHSRISKLESLDDETEPSLSDLIAYRNFFNVSIDYLLGFESEPSTNIELKTISKEYGISAKALVNIKNILLDHSFAAKENPDNFEGRLKSTLNTLLESPMFEIFLKNCSRYFSYYPFSNEFAYAISLKTQPFDPENDDYEINIQANYDDFFEDNNKLTFDSHEFNDMILSTVKNTLILIKEDSEFYYKNLLKELEYLKAEYESFISALDKSNAFFNRFSDDDIERLKRNRQIKIAKIQKEIQKYKQSYIF